MSIPVTEGKPPWERVPPSIQSLGLPPQGWSYRKYREGGDTLQYPLGYFLEGLLPGDAGALGSTPLPGVWLQGSNRAQRKRRNIRVSGPWRLPGGKGHRRIGAIGMGTW